MNKQKHPRVRYAIDRKWLLEPKILDCDNTNIFFVLRLDTLYTKYMIYGFTIIY